MDLEDCSMDQKSPGRLSTSVLCLISDFCRFNDATSVLICFYRSHKVQKKTEQRNLHIFEKVIVILVDNIKRTSSECFEIFHLRIRHEKCKRKILKMSTLNFHLNTMRSAHICMKSDYCMPIVCCASILPRRLTAEIWI